MSPLLASPAAGAARPAVEVRAVDGMLLPRINAAEADVLLRRGWAEWIGTGSRRYLRLTEGAPLVELSPQGTRGDGTRPVRAGGGAGSPYKPGQFVGDPLRNREHCLDFSDKPAKDRSRRR